MNNNNNETLKPGDRVRLTGWAERQNTIFYQEGRSFPCETPIYEGDTSKNEAAVLCLDKWDLRWFTYEIITDGNG